MLQKGEQKMKLWGQLHEGQFESRARSEGGKACLYELRQLNSQH